MKRNNDNFEKLKIKIREKEDKLIIENIIEDHKK